MRVAILIPCRNEAVSIAQVVRDFAVQVPAAEIYVYDNGSTDGTAGLAAAAGARVGREPAPGKGNVVRRMFADIEADLYLLVDGDGTYDAVSAPAMIDLAVEDCLDMVSGSRIFLSSDAFPSGHRFGNRLFTGIVGRFFRSPFKDVLTGYRVMSRRFVKSFPVVSTGFEIEIEIAIHAMELRAPCAEIETRYGGRAPNSASKLRKWRDGLRILRLIVHLFKEERPLSFFAFEAALFGAASLAFGTPVIDEFLRTGLVPRLPTAVLASGLAIMSFLALLAGLILDTVTHGRRETKRLSYLSYAPPSPGRASRSSEKS